LMVIEFSPSGGWISAGGRLAVDGGRPRRVLVLRARPRCSAQPYLPAVPQGRQGSSRRRAGRASVVLYHGNRGLRPFAGVLGGDQAAGVLHKGASLASLWCASLWRSPLRRFATPGTTKGVWEDVLLPRSRVLDRSRRHAGEHPPAVAAPGEQPRQRGNQFDATACARPSFPAAGRGTGGPARRTKRAPPKRCWPVVDKPPGEFPSTSSRRPVIRGAPDICFVTGRRGKAGAIEDLRPQLRELEHALVGTAGRDRVLKQVIATERIAEIPLLAASARSDRASPLDTRFLGFARPNCTFGIPGLGGEGPFTGLLHDEIHGSTRGALCCARCALGCNERREGSSVVALQGKMTARGTDSVSYAAASEPRPRRQRRPGSRGRNVRGRIVEEGSPARGKGRPRNLGVSAGARFSVHARDLRPHGSIACETGGAGGVFQLPHDPQIRRVCCSAEPEG